MNIIERIAVILGIHVTGETFEREISIQDASGRITQKVILRMLIAIIKYLYEREKDTIVQPTKRSV